MDFGGGGEVKVAGYGIFEDCGGGGVVEGLLWVVWEVSEGVDHAGCEGVATSDAVDDVVHEVDFGLVEVMVGGVEECVEYVSFGVDDVALRDEHVFAIRGECHDLSAELAVRFEVVGLGVGGESEG